MSYIKKNIKLLILFLFLIVPIFSHGSGPLDFNNTINNPRTDFKQYYYDIHPDHWAKDSIVRLTQLGILKGYNNRYFYPEKNVSLREFLTMLGNFLAIKDEEILKPIRYNQNFLLNESQWGYLEISNVINRIPKEKLFFLDFSKLDRQITKEEVAYIIENLFLFKSEANKEEKLLDLDQSIFKKEIEILYKAGVISGEPSNMFYPKQNITRAELATILNNMAR